MVNPDLLLSQSRVHMARVPDLLDGLLGGLDLADWRARPLAQEWAPIEVVCHLRDEEVEDFGARLRTVVEGGHEFTRIAPQRWVTDRRYLDADPAGTLAEFRSRRLATLAFLDSVRPERLASSVGHPALGRLSGVDLLAAWVAHDRLHLAQLANTLARLWAARWAPARVEYAGPIPYGAPDA